MEGPNGPLQSPLLKKRPQRLMNTTELQESVTATGAGHPVAVRENYRGWIPTVSGHLSFSVLGQTDNPTKATTANVVDDKHRYIVGFQRRPILDGLIPILNAYLPVFRGKGLIGLRRDRNLFFVVIGKAQKSATAPNALKGKILIYRPKDWKSARAHVENCQKILFDLEEETKKINKPLYPGAEQAMNVSSASALAEFDFILYRNGIVSISMEALSKLVKIVPESDYELNSQYLEWVRDQVASQAFYFIRDMTHRHQHHCPTSDTLTNLHRVPAAHGLPVGHRLSFNDEYAWMLRVYRHLSRGVIKQKRDGDDSALEESLGILAYTRAFVAIARDHLAAIAYSNVAKEQAACFPGTAKHYFDTLKASIEARLKTKATEARLWDSDVRTKFSISALVLSIIAINISALFGMLSNESKYSFDIPVKQYFYKGFVENTLVTNAAIVALIWVFLYLNKPRSMAGNIFDTQLARAAIFLTKKQLFFSALFYFIFIGYALYLVFQL